MSQEQSKDMSQYFYRASAADFMKIPGSPVAYWASAGFRECFVHGHPLKTIAPAKLGMRTGDNDKWLRRWFEVSRQESKYNAIDAEAAEKSGKKWFPYNKGGDFRRWYGNNEHIIFWKDNGHAIKHETLEKYPQLTWDNLGWKITNEPDFFKPSCTWTFISSSSFGVRANLGGALFDVAGSSAFPEEESIWLVTGFLCSRLSFDFLKLSNPTLNFQVANVNSLPWISPANSDRVSEIAKKMVSISKEDWDSYETSWDFTYLPTLDDKYRQPRLRETHEKLREDWHAKTQEMLCLEEENNRLFIEAYGLQDELTPDVPLNEITLTCNPHYRYGGNRSEDELETLLQCDTLRELVSYALGCMMGRYSLDKPGLILASQGETLEDYLRQIPSPRFAPDTDAILPLTDQEWFADDATNRFREFIRVVWGDEHLQQNLDFVAESLCLHAIKAKRGESALDTTRRYLSTQFFKDHMRTYKKRPIYWLFSSGKHKAFECLVYLHRYNEGTLARMRTEYVIPLSARLNSYAEKLEQAKDAAGSTAETKRLEKELTTLHNQQAELAEFDEKLRYYADQRISLDLDDGVKVNYGKFGDLLSEVKSITGA